MSPFSTHMRLGHLRDFVIPLLVYPQLLFMSSSVDSRRPTGIWSYIPFGSTSPRRRSVSLPYRANNISDPLDPFEKPNRHSSTGVGLHSRSSMVLESLQNAWMTPSQRSRYIKVAGVVLFTLCVLLYLSGSGTVLSGGGST